MSDTIRVAIAEDSAVLRDGLVQLLADRGFVITDAVGAANALEKAVERDCPDVAVVDIRMPPTFTDEGCGPGSGCTSDTRSSGSCCSRSTSRPVTWPQPSAW